MYSQYDEGGVNDYIYLSKIEDSESASKRPLRCVFFSFIEPEKGVDIILDSAKETPKITYHFYGHVQGEYADTFFSFVNLHKNVFYHGIFQGSQEEIYEELKKYDVLLLPTRWENEGVPGILIESKMVGLVEIVSDHNYNAEIVRDGTEGVILRKNTSEELAAVLNDLDANREVLQQLKIGSEKSAERYDVMNYINRIYEVLALM